jgi:hypothetical protein
MVHSSGVQRTSPKAMRLALDGNLDATTEGHLKCSLAASKPLIYITNDLLDLTILEYSDLLLHEESFFQKE